MPTHTEMYAYTCDYVSSKNIKMLYDLGIKVEAQQNFRQFYDWWMARRWLNSTRKCFFILAFFYHSLEYLEHEDYDGISKSEV